MLTIASMRATITDIPKIARTAIQDSGLPPNVNRRPIVAIRAYSQMLSKTALAAIRSLSWAKLTGRLQSVEIFFQIVYHHAFGKFWTIFVAYKHNHKFVALSFEVCDRLFQIVVYQRDGNDQRGSDRKLPRVQRELRSHWPDGQWTNCRQSFEDYSKLFG